MLSAIPFRTTQATQLPLTFQEVCDYLQVDVDESSTEGNNIKLLMTVARDTAEAYTGKQLMPADYELHLTDWWQKELVLKTVPFLKVEEVTYFDHNGTSQSLQGGTHYRFRKIGPMLGGITLLLSSRPDLVFENGSYRDDAVTIKFTAGYPSAEAVPGNIKLAMLLMIREAYDTRKDTLNDRKRLSESLLDLERWIS